MKQFIAYCGLDCETCEARLATVNDDDKLRRRVAGQWSALNGVEITPAMINCVGCRLDGAKTPYCDSICPIRQCAMSKGVETCGACAEMDSCDKVVMIIKQFPIITTIHQGNHIIEKCISGKRNRSIYQDFLCFFF